MTLIILEHVVTSEVPHYCEKEKKVICSNCASVEKKENGREKVDDEVFLQLDGFWFFTWSKCKTEYFSSKQYSFASSPYCQKKEQKIPIIEVTILSGMHFGGPFLACMVILP